MREKTVPSEESAIVGVWKCLNGDYALANEYRADGTMVQHVGGRSTRPHPFRVEGDFLVSSIEQPNGSISETRTRFELSGDTLTLMYTPRQKMLFRRTEGI